jgi:nitrite reductase/ring-hydroxylating ferredoxin subunit
VIRIPVAKADAFEEGRARVVAVGRIDVAVFLAGGCFYAVKDACPHQGHPLSSGRVVDGILNCPGHSWQFEIATGRCIKGDTELSLRMFDVAREGNDVFIEMQGE